MDAVVDTADRSAGLLLQLTASVSVIQSTDVRLLSGFAKLNLDGQHLDPQPTVRGSNGGSKTEYEIMRGGPFSFYCDPAISLKLARPAALLPQAWRDSTFWTRPSAQPGLPIRLDPIPYPCICCGARPSPLCNPGGNTHA